MIFFRFLIVLLFSLFAQYAFCSQGEYIYSNWSAKVGGGNNAAEFTESYFIINTHNNVFYSGHFGVPFSNCSGEWSCLRSFVFNFAVPNDKKYLPAKWEFDGFLYENLGIDNVKYFGVEESVYKINSLNISNDKVASNPTIFYYSITKGILGFTILWYKEEHKVRFPLTYWLESTQGYGHSK